MSESPLLRPPTLGDAEAAFRRLIDKSDRKRTSIMADVLIVRDWISHVTFYLRCCLKRESQSACPPDCDSMLLRLLDDRVTTGRPGVPD